MSKAVSHYKLKKVEVRKCPHGFDLIVTLKSGGHTRSHAVELFNEQYTEEIAGILIELGKTIAHDETFKS